MRKSVETENPLELKKLNTQDSVQHSKHELFTENPRIRLEVTICYIIQLIVEG